MFATVAVAVLEAVGVLVSEPSLAVTVTVTCSPRFPWFDVDRSNVSVVDATFEVVCRVAPFDLPHVGVGQRVVLPVGPDRGGGDRVVRPRRRVVSETSAVGAVFDVTIVTADDVTGAE